MCSRASSALNVRVASPSKWNSPEFHQACPLGIRANSTSDVTMLNFAAGAFPHESLPTRRGLPRTASSHTPVSRRTPRVANFSGCADRSHGARRIESVAPRSRFTDSIGPFSPTDNNTERSRVCACSPGAAWPRAASRTRRFSPLHLIAPQGLDTALRLRDTGSVSERNAYESRLSLVSPLARRVGNCLFGARGRRGSSGPRHRCQMDRSLRRFRR